MTDLSKNIEALREKKAVIEMGGGEAAIEKQVAMGKLTARERILALLDKNSFHEYDMFVEHDGRDFGMEKKVLPGDGVVTGTGTIFGAPVCIYAQDFTVAGGSLGLQHARKITKIMDHALKMKCPIIGINDSGGARHEDGTLEYIAPIQYKFQGTTLEGSNERSWYDDYPIYRYADALLLLAEAKALLGEDPSTEINAVRERAYGSEYFNAHKNEVAYPNDKGSFYNDNPFEAGDENVMEAILKERLREFFFEGKRWYDLRRFGKDYVLKYTTAQESRLLWPINEGALTNNPALKQTPGY